MDQRYLLDLDQKNYREGWKKKSRHSVRAIICQQGMYAMIHSERYGEYKFPGGGMEQGETQMDTLLREVREETGLLVIPESVVSYGVTREAKKDRLRLNVIFEQYSYFYRCEVKEERVERELDDYERDFGYKLCWVPLRQAISNNEQLQDREVIPWLERDTRVMRLLLSQEG